MSTLPTVDVEAEDAVAARAAAHPDGEARPLLVCLPSMGSEAATNVFAQMAASLSSNVLIASPDHDVEQPAAAGLPAIVPYTRNRGDSEWVLSTDDYLAAASLAETRGAAGVLLLGPEIASLAPEALRTMQAGLVSGADLALPRYETAADDGLVNSALLYPLTRALFGADIRFPLPLDAGLSTRMLKRLAEGAARAGAQTESALLWPVAEASLAGFSVRQVEGGPRTLPQPQDADLNQLFPAVTASLFGDIEAKANYWQRARALPSRTASARNAAMAAPTPTEEIRSLVDGFRIAFNNLREIWSLVLPPQSLLALKKLSVSTPEAFLYPPSLWARTVYDFALAYHLRTLNRGHLLGALTPLYLAWVGSFLRSSDGDQAAGAELLQLTAAAFEQEKPYLVSRWRWPDRFNP